MYIVIVGAGEVGSAIAESLASSHDVAVIDLDEECVETLTDETDVLGIEGDGTNLDTLEEANIEQADIFIASTDDDETNIVSCSTTNTVTEAFTISRLRSPKYLRTWENSKDAFGIDHMVATSLQTAEIITKVVDLPAAQDVEVFADGLVEMAELEIPESSPVANLPVQETESYRSLTFAAVFREDVILIPSGETVLKPGDDVIVIGSPESIHTFAHELEPDMDGALTVLIIGGSDIGYHTARLLQERGVKPQLIEKETKRARELAEELSSTTVFEGDATDRELLEQEHIEDVDVVVSTLEKDEKNLLTGLLAKRLGAKRAITVVNSREYLDLFEEIGIDAAVNPREATAEGITRFTREQEAENVAIIDSDRAEVLEIEVDEGSVLMDRPIGDSVAELPKGMVIGAITRGAEVLLPRDDTVIEHGDHVVVFVDTESLAEVSGKL